MTKKRAAKGQGSIFLKGGEYKAKHWVTVDGVEVRRTFSLGTTSQGLAKAKNAALVEALRRGEIPGAEQTRAVETFKDAVERICTGLDYQKTIENRRSRLRRYAGHMDALRVDKCGAIHLREALDKAAKAGKSKGTIGLLKKDLNVVFGSLWRDEIIKEDPSRKVKLPGGLREDDRPRQILTDEEFLVFVGSAVVPWRLRIMAMCSRMLGGMRTSDLLAWDWSHIDTREFRTARVKRPKTKSATYVQIPEALRTVLLDWWTEHRCPGSGPVFPSAPHRSYSGELRLYLRRAFELDGPAPRRLGSRGATGWTQLRAMTERERELLEDGEFSRRVDFHSFRRAYVTGLASGAVDERLAMRLSGHTSPEVHRGYLDRLRPIATPEAALPRLQLVPKMGPIVTDPAKKKAG